MKAPRVGFILYCIPNAACMENWSGFYFQTLCTGIDFFFLNDEILFQFTRYGFVYRASSCGIKGKVRVV